MCPYAVVAKDRLPDVVSTYPSAFVCNAHYSDQPGEHWVAIYVDERGDCFDPYHIPIQITRLHSSSEVQGAAVTYYVPSWAAP